MPTKEQRELFEKILDDFHKDRFKFISDRDVNGTRVVTLSKYGATVVLVLEEQGVAFDTFADLKTGIYELGDLHTLTRVMLAVKKKCLDLGCREMNTTERLYPQERQGSETKTSGL